MLSSLAGAGRSDLIPVTPTWSAGARTARCRPSTATASACSATWAGASWWTSPTWARSRATTRGRPTSTPSPTGRCSRARPRTRRATAAWCRRWSRTCRRPIATRGSPSAAQRPQPEPAAALSRLRQPCGSRLRQQRSYNSLQAALQRRFSKGFTFGVSYTLSRAKTDSAGTGDATHPFDLAAYDYALANFDRTHYFVANYVWNVPKGSGLLGGGRLARGLLDNWTISGISWIASGNPVELGLNIAGVNADPAPARHRRGRQRGRPAAALPRRGRPRSGDGIRPGGLRRARHRRLRALRPLLPAQPRLQQPRPVGLQELPDRQRRQAHDSSSGSRCSTSSTTRSSPAST